MGCDVKHKYGNLFKLQIYFINIKILNDNNHNNKNKLE